MVQERPRVQKVLLHLYSAEGLVRPKEIADKLGESALNVGKDLHDLKGRELAVTEGEGQWKITDMGRQWLESDGGKGAGTKAEQKAETKETAETVPSQSDIFRAIGEKMGAGSKKDDVRLDAIIYYIQRTGDLDDLSSVWNALTEMGVARDIRKRWIKLYAQTIPGIKISEDLKEKISSGTESERVKVGDGEATPKPTRFIVINGQIIGDPEGDYNFREALQVIAERKGAPPDEAGATALALSKMGPDMISTLLTAITPFISTGKTKEGETETGLLDQLGKLGLLSTGKTREGEAETGLLNQLDKMGLLRKSGEDDESSKIVSLLQTEIKELKEAMTKQELDTMKSAVVSLSEQFKEFRQDIANQGKLEGRFAILDKTIDAADHQLSGFRDDLKAVVLGATGSKSEPVKKSAADRARITKGLKEAIGKEKEARDLENELLFSTQIQT